MKKYLFILIPALISVAILPVLRVGNAEIEAEIDEPTQDIADKLITLQENTLISVANPNNPEPKVARKVNAIITAYSSTVWQTDDTPFITAAGTTVRDGIIANNVLPFGTKVRIPALYGDKIFMVEDRMSWKKSNDHFDIWFVEYKQALNFGAQLAKIEILEN